MNIRFLMPAILALIASIETRAATDCVLPDAPAIPDGELASRDTMEVTALAVRAFIADAQDYQACLQEQEVELGEAITDEQQEAIVEAFNAAVDAMNSTAEAFNEQLGIWRSRQEDG